MSTDLQLHSSTEIGTVSVMAQISDYSRKVISSVKAELARQDLPFAALIPVLGYAQSTVYEISQYKRSLTTDEIHKIANRLGIATSVLTTVSFAEVAVASDSGIAA